MTPDDYLAYFVEGLAVALATMTLWLPILLLWLWRGFIDRHLHFLAAGVLMLAGMEALLALIYFIAADPAWLHRLTSYPTFPCEPSFMCGTVDFLIKWGNLMVAAADLLSVGLWVVLMRKFRPRWAGFSKL